MWFALAVAALAVVVQGHHYTSLEAEPLFAAFDHHQQQNYLFGDPYYPSAADLYESHPFEPSYEQIPSLWYLFQPTRPQFMSYEAQPNSLINYTPVKPGSWITPNVHIKGRGYFTDRYVAPTMLEKYLAMNPR